MCVHFKKHRGRNGETERTTEREREREREIQEKTGPITFLRGTGICRVGEVLRTEPQDQKTAGAERSLAEACRPTAEATHHCGRSKKSLCECSPFIGRFARLRAFPYVQTGLPTARERARGRRDCFRVSWRATELQSRNSKDFLL